MNFKEATYTILVSIILLTSCKSTKNIAGGEADPSLSSKRIIEKHYANYADFNTLSGRVKIDYNDGESSQGVNVSFRMQKDEVIWISAPLGIVKAYITPTSVSFYNKLENEFFEGDYGYLSNILGVELDFDKLQNVLLGYAIFDLRKERYNAEVVNSNYQLDQKRPDNIIQALFNLEPKNFRISKQRLEQPLENRTLQINYSYQEVEETVIPNQVYILALENGDVNNIALEYKGMELNKELNFPYKIPNGFKEIVLK